MNLVQDDATYRRGLVLGLTMAEIMLLLLFVLLLALSFLLQEEEKRFEEAQQTVERQEQQIAQFEDLKATLAAAAADPGRINDLFLELEIARSEREEAINSAEQMREQLDEAQAAAEQAEDFQELVEVLEGSGLTPERVAELVEKERIADAVVSAGFPSDPAALGETLASAAELRTQLEQMAGEKLKAEQYADYFKRLAGLSNQMPPCWMDDEHRPDYIFDVELHSNGVIVYDRDLPKYREKRKELPLNGIAYESTLSSGAFVDAFRPLYDWSVAQKCRFFVRIFDRTGSAEKERYKALLRRVEGYFYKLLVEDDRIRPGSI